MLAHGLRTKTEHVPGMGIWGRPDVTNLMTCINHKPWYLMITKIGHEQNYYLTLSDISSIRIASCFAHLIRTI